MQSGQVPLQQLLHEIEGGMPFLFIHQLLNAGGYRSEQGRVPADVAYRYGTMESS